MLLSHYTVMNKHLFFAIFILCNMPLSLFSQKHDYFWIDGLYSGPIEGFRNFKIDFSVFPPEIEFFNVNLLITATNLSVSNYEGKLIMYSDGCVIFNAHLEIMQGAETINEGFYNNLLCGSGGGYGVIHGIFGLPFADSLFLLMHHRMLPYDDGDCLLRELLTTKVDMRADNGLGAIVYKDSVLLSIDCMQLACANKHANGRDWWVVVPDHKSDIFYRFLVSPEEIQGPWAQSLANPTRDSFDTCGWSEFSPNGEMFMINACDKGIAVYDFDRCSGMLSNLRHIPDTTENESRNIGATFSPNSRLLYATRGNADRLVQYDLAHPDLVQSETTVAVWDSFYYVTPGSGTKIWTKFLYMYPGPDGKIYNWTSSAPFMHLIHYPNRKGAACAVEQRAVQLPNFVASANSYYPHYRLGPIDGSPCDTLSIDNRPVALFRHEIEDTLAPLQVTFTDLSYYEPAEWHWDFGDGSTSTDTSPVHVFPSSNVYQVCLTVRNANAEDTYCKPVTVGTVSAPELPFLPKLTVHPNPCVDFLTVQQPALMKIVPRFSLADVFGRLVLEQALSDFSSQVDVRHLPSGVYFWQYWFGHQAVQSGKVVKQ
jgi:hypothetical protein